MSSGNEIKSSEITPESVYLNRRNFIRAAALAGSTVVTGMAYKFFNPPPPKEIVSVPIENLVKAEPLPSGETLNTFAEITNYNNYYEFTTSKEGVARAAQDFVTRPWTIEVGGLVQKPRVFDIDEILKIEQEERIYRFRCVEGWSMVIPWVGFPLKKILDAVEPLGKAKYAAFETFYNGSKSTNPAVKLPEGRNSMQPAILAGIDLPYVEGLRLDEAMHPLTILATGLYGKQMPNQNGAPVRLVVPWKYGFKSIKSVVRIMLTDSEPPTTWNIQARNEYGFYSNVNPNVAHPRWSQADEKRIGQSGRIKTQMFNGYENEVGKLYDGMDLKKNF